MKNEPDISAYRDKRGPSRRTILVLAAILILVIGGILAAFLFVSTTKQVSNRGLSSSDFVKKDYDVSQIPLTGLDKDGRLDFGTVQQVSINGQLRVNNTLVITPTAQPQTTSTGQIYYDKASNKPFYFNGFRFVAFASDQDINRAISGLGLGALSKLNSLGGGLSTQGGTLNNTGVLSLQGQTGNVTLNGGGGIGISGTTITNTGVTGIIGTANQISASSSTGEVVLSLPQDIAPSSSPTFAALTADSLTARPSASILTIGSSDKALELQGSSTTLSQTSSGFTSTLGFVSPSADQTINLPDESGTVCLQLSTNCGFLIGSGAGFVQNGNSFGTLATLGTNDSQGLALETAGIERVRISSTGDVGIGTTGPGYKLDVVGDVNTTTLYRVGGVPISSANLTNDANIAKLNGNQTFTGTNNFTNAGNSFAGNGAGLTALNADNITTGTLGVAQGGTGVDGTMATNGQLLIGNGSGFSLATLTAGTGIIITNSAGGIQLDVAGAGSCVTCADVSLSNLNNVAINTSLLTGGSNIDLGSGVNPFRDLYLGGSTVNNIRVTGTATAPRTITLPDASGTVAVSASGNIALSVAGNISFTGQLPIANGGTNTTATPIAGGLAYGTGTAYAFTSFGVLGQVVTSGGAGSPSFQNLSDLLTPGSNIAITGTVTPTIAVVASPTFTNLTATGQVSIQGASSLSLGTNTNLGSIAFHDGVSANTGTLQLAGTLAGNTTYALPTGTGTQNICTIEAGNCAGSGTGVTGSGNTNRVAKFTADGQNIGNSNISDDGTTVSISTGAAIQGSAGLTLGTAGVTGKLVFKNSTNANTLTLQSGASSGNLTFTLPTSDGGANDCLKTNGSGGWTFAACTGGAGGGVTSVNTQSGIVTIAGTTNQINVTSGSGTITLATPQDIATTSDVNFHTLGLSGSNAGILVNASTGASANLIDLQVNGSSKFAVAPSGNITTTGTINNQTISAAGITSTGYVNASGGALQTNSVDRISNAGNIVNVGTITTSGLINGQNISSTAIFSGTLAVTTLGTPDSSIALCRNGSNQISGCLTTGNGAAFVQGGNSFGALAVLGTNDNNSLSLRTNGTEKVLIDTSGNVGIGVASSGYKLQVAGTGFYSGNLTVGTTSSVATISSPGAGTNSEHFGVGSTAAGAGAIAFGSGASAAIGGSIAIGQNAAVANNGSNSGSIAIGNGATTAGHQSISLGSGATTTGNLSIAIGPGAVAGDAAIALGYGATTTAANQLVIGGTSSSIQNVYIGKGVTNATPTTLTIQGTGGSGTDIAGATVNLAGGKGTGTGAGGGLNFQVAAPAGATGSSLNALSTVFSLSGSNGAALFKNTTNSTTAFQIQNAAGSVNVLTADTTNGRIGVGTAAPGYPLDVAGDVNSSGVYRINGVAICTASGCTAAGGSGNYIQNGTALQTANFNIQSAAAGSVAASITGASGQTANLLNVIGGSGTVSINAAGNLAVSGSTTTGTLGVGGAVPGSGGYNGTLNVSTNAAGTIGQIIRGVTSQTADLLQLQNSAGVALTKVGSSGILNFGGGSLRLGTFDNIIADGLSIPYIAGDGNRIVIGAPGYLQLRNIPKIVVEGGTYFEPAAASSTPLIGQGVSAQTGDLLQLRNSSAAVLLNVTAGGNLNLAATSATGGQITQGGNRLIHTTGGVTNFFAGTNAGNLTLTGTRDTGIGQNALAALTSGTSNTAVGFNSLVQNTTGVQNTAIGDQALTANVDGGGNVANGFTALSGNTSGSSNVGLGLSALGINTTGSNNVGVGYFAGRTSTLANANTTGSNNSFIGYNSGPGSTTQLQNATAIGTYATVNQNDSLVLGCISGVNGCTASTKVGIGTATPGSKLDIAGGQLTFSSAAASFLGYGIGRSGTDLVFNGGTTGYTFNSSNNTANLVRITDTGNLGINNNTPSNKLSVNTLTTADSLAQATIGTSATTNKGLVIQGVASQTADLLQLQNSTGTSLLSVSAVGNISTQGGIAFTNSAAPPLAGPSVNGTGDGLLLTAGVTAGVRINNSGNSAELLRVTNAGNVGIGTNAPSSLLQLGSDAGTAASGIKFGSTGDTNLYRSAADALKTDDNLTANSLNTANTLTLGVGTANAVTLSAVAGGNASSSGGVFALGQLVAANGSAGQVNIGAVGPGSAAALLIGADTNLYRSAADTLKTDDSLIVGTIGSGGTNLLCYDGTNKLATCSGAPGAGSYINNGTALQTANFNIQSAAAGSVGGIIRGAASQTADLLQLQDSTGIVLNAFGANGGFTMKSPVGGGVVSFSVGANGAARTYGSLTVTDQQFNNQGIPLLVQGFYNQVTAAIKGSASQTSDLLQLQNSGGTSLLNVTSGGNLNLAATSATGGQITQGGARLIHTTGGVTNFFAGTNAGNLTLTGTANTGIGQNVLLANTTGTGNTAVGQTALQANTSGNYNTANGSAALGLNTTGTDNTSVGAISLANNSTGNYNVAFGRNALVANTTGSNNTSLGGGTGYTNTAANANTTGSNNTFVGYSSGSGTTNQLQNATALGTYATVGNSNGLSLGCVAGVNTCATTTNIGIGVADVQSRLQVQSNALTGTGTITTVGTAVTGTGTSFTTQAKVGDTIIASNQARRITAIGSTTGLTIDTAFATDLATATTFTFTIPTHTISGSGASLFRNQTDSAAAFQVQTAAGATLLNINSTTGLTSMGNLTSNNVSITYGGANSTISTVGSQLFIQAVSEVGIYTAGVNRLDVNSLGNVGIGTTGQGARLQVNTGAVGTIGQIIQGFSGQTADLLQFQDSSGTLLSKITSDGTALFKTANLNNVPIIAQGAVGQSAELQRWVDSTGAILARVTANGSIVTTFGVQSPYFTDATNTRAYLDMTLSGLGITAVSRVTSNVVLAVRGAPSQTADLLQVQNSSGTVLSKFDSAGNLTVGTSTTPATISSPGAGTSTERFGAGATTGANNFALAVGNGASVTGGNGVAIGQGASAGVFGTAVGQGASNAATGVALGYASNSGTNGVSIGYGAANVGDSISIGRGATTTAAGQLVIANGGSAISNVYIGNGVTNAAPTGFTLQSTGGSGTDIAGASINLAGGKGTGAGAGGAINLQIAKPGTTGATLNSLTTVASLNGTTGAALFKNATDSTTAFQIQNVAGTSNLFVADTTNSRIGIGTAAPSSLLQLGSDVGTAASGIKFGSTGDTNLYRSAADTLQTDDSLVVRRNLDVVSTLDASNMLFRVRDTDQDYGLSYQPDTNGLQLQAPALGSKVLTTRTTGNSVDNFQIETSGKLSWGEGIISLDTNLYRSAADTLKTDDSFIIGTNLNVSGVSTLASLTVTGATSTGSLAVTGAAIFNGDIAFSANTRGKDEAITLAANTLVISGKTYPDASYSVLCTPNYNTTCFVTNKTATGFTLNFGTAAPASSTVDWIVIR